MAQTAHFKETIFCSLSTFSAMLKAYDMMMKREEDMVGKEAEAGKGMEAGKGERN